MSLAAPELAPQRCVRYRFRYSDCARCRDACPHDAIEPTDEGVNVDPARCRGCGLCAAACRTEALSGALPPRVPTLRRAMGEARFSFACAPSGLAADAVVPCLGAIDAPSLAFLGKRGVAVELRGAGHCGACPHGAKGAAMLEQQLDAVDHLCAAVAQEGWAAVTLAADGAAPARASRTDTARRQLFRRVLGGGLEALAAADRSAARAPDKAIRAGAPFATEQRDLLALVCRRTTDGNAPIRLAPHEGLPVAGLSMEPGCTACDACFRACPTGALQIAESSTSWTLAFTAERCTACGVCREVCQPRVLRLGALADATPGRGARPLHRLSKQRCERCDRFFVSAAETRMCPVCADDEIALDRIFG